ncbi:MAG: DUF1232 domain-containing protein [Hyphomonadaceae bacterium]|nr:DUF1232 domain-containing protein [Hyphomonadaceae bacterium]
MLDALKHWARALRRDTLALYLAARDPRTPWYAKAWAAFVVAYAFSPIDLIPDFIPVLGYLDDLILLPAGLWLALKLIPAPLMEEHRRAAAILAEKPVNRTAALVIVALWIAAIGLAIWLAAATVAR